MTKTIPLDESVHKYLKKVQSILYHEYNIEMRLQDILTYIINDKIVGDAHKVAKRVFEDTIKNNDIAEANEYITVVPRGLSRVRFLPTAWHRSVSYIKW